ncbi:hypothetical protein PtA15_12A438 [Puccinia triticina]|uniref:hAT-like transposase RNase-H fold domain-containing protein n=1 Tax=Puccinia triticina TaxID=208348 RepID=A0ABY7CYP8_9BASI|nr:uncharacterized protein PtA15_12A438 [Puccinia triticina]WAQ90449.1 hypothetical protein PtA15_12A438 [Puccinia triticina]
MFKRQKTEQGNKFISDGRLTSNSLKKAIAYMIADADLPFSFVERESFRNVLELLNPSVQTGQMLFGRKNMALEVHHLYGAHSQYLKMFFKNFKHVAFTLDAWTSPNKMAFMAVTAHAINSKWELVDVAVAMPVIHG